MPSEQTYATVSLEMHKIHIYIYRSPQPRALARGARDRARAGGARPRGAGCAAGLFTDHWRSISLDLGAPLDLGRTAGLWCSRGAARGAAPRRCTCRLFNC